MGDKIIKSKNLCCQPVVFPSLSLLKRIEYANPQYKKDINFKFLDDQFLDLVHKIYFNQTTLDLRKKQDRRYSDPKARNG